MKTNPRLQEVLRFGIVGAASTLIQFVAYFLLAGVTNHNIALPVSYALSLLFNFLMTTYFTFRVKPDARKGMGFLASHAVNFTLQFLLLNLFIWTGIHKQWAIIPVFMVCIPVNFLLVRWSMKRL